MVEHNQPMPRGGARPGSGPKPKPPGTTRTEVFTTRCTPDEKLKYEALKAGLDAEYAIYLAELKKRLEEQKKNAK